MSRFKKLNDYLSVDEQINSGAEDRAIEVPPAPCAWVRDDGGYTPTSSREGYLLSATRAVSIATGRRFRDVYNALTASLTYWRRPPWRAVSVAIHRYITRSGWRWTPTMGIGTGCRVHLRADELPAGRLLVSVSRRLVAVIDGVIHDVADPSRGGTRCVYGYWSRP